MRSKTVRVRVTKQQNTAVVSGSPMTPTVPPPTMTCLANQLRQFALQQFHSTFIDGHDKLPSDSDCLLPSHLVYRSGSPVWLTAADFTSLMSNVCAKNSLQFCLYASLLMLSKILREMNVLTREL